MRLRILFFCMPILCLITQAFAQSNLTRQIAMGRIDHQRIGVVLKKIAAKGEFTFAYNNQTVPADSLISMNDFNGTIYSFLSRTLGADYEFKEVPGYIVLRHAPYKMTLNASVDEVTGQQLTLRGQVFNAGDKLPLKQVSIYERNQLVSTLTDDRGNFELKLANPAESITLTATKENFRDTSLLLLQEVKINSTKKKTYKYHPEETVNKVGRGFARWFISSKQRIQNLNLGGFFAFSPYQVSLTPGLSSHGMYSGQVVDHVSFNMLGGYTAGVQGVELGGLFNINRWDVSFLQAAGLFNTTGGNMRGIQIAGAYNQVLNNTSGVQVAGITNAAGDVKGLQVAGLFNIAKKVKGVQLAGLFNVADSSDYPIGLLNFIKNGRKSLSLSYDELQYLHIDFRSGGRVLYGIIGAGSNFKQSDKWAFDMGFGAHLISQRLFTLDGEYCYEALTDFKKDPAQVSSFRLLAGVKLGKQISLFGGPSINFASYSASEPLDMHGWQVHKYINGNNINNIYAGITGGLQFTW